MLDTQYRQMVDVYAKQQASIITELLRALLGLWIPFRWADRPDMVNALAAASAAQVDASVSQARMLARARLTAELRALQALPPRSPAFEPIYPRSGTPIVEVYKRPARQYEHAIRTGKTPEQAEKVLVERLEDIATSDIRAAARDEGQKMLAASPKVIGWRRALHPEKTKYGPCGLCIVAADRLYSVEELMPLHGECVCEPVAVTGSSDPWLRLNKADLAELYEAAGSTYAEDLKRIRVRVDEHGELGPILHRDGDEFKDVGKVNRQSQRMKFKPYTPPTKATDTVQWGGMRSASERSIEILEEARRNGTNLVDMAGLGRVTEVRDIDKAIEWHRSLIARAGLRSA